MVTLTLIIQSKNKIFNLLRGLQLTPLSLHRKGMFYKVHLNFLQTNNAPRSF